MFMRLVFGIHNDECMKGLERHKTGMFNEYVRKCFETARKLQDHTNTSGKCKSMHIYISGSKGYIMF